MARRSLDMLPLLDVFMVVLFVFATIQEQQLDSSVQALDEATAALAAAEAANTELLDELLSETIASARAEAEAEAAAETVAELRTQLDDYQRACGPRTPGGPTCPAASAEAREAAETVAVHERLRSRVAVFEVQLEGDPDLETGRLQTRCCFRADPPEGAWRSCGEIPSGELERSAWFEAGAAGLVDGLDEPEQDAAVILLAQDPSAKFLASDDLADLLRERFPNHRVYDDGTRTGPAVCPAPAAEPGLPTPSP